MEPNQWPRSPKRTSLPPWRHGSCPNCWHLMSDENVTSQSITFGRPIRVPDSMPRSVAPRVSRVARGPTQRKKSGRSRRVNECPSMFVRASRPAADSGRGIDRLRRCRGDEDVPLRCAGGSETKEPVQTDWSIEAGRWARQLSPSERNPLHRARPPARPRKILNAIFPVITILFRG